MMTRTCLFTATIMCSMLWPGTLLAGGLVTNTNQHIRFLRMFAVDASTGTDAIFSNPAGTAFMEDGVYLAINSQTVKQTRTITADYSGFENGRKQFDGKTFVPVYPQIDAAWKTGRWNFSLALSVIGGGGKCEFNDGLPSFEAAIATIPARLSNQGISTTKYSVDSYMNGEQYVWSAQTGASRLLTANLSAYIGVRLNWVRNLYKGYMRNICINPVFQGNPAGGMMPAADFFAALSFSLANSNPALATTAAGYAAATGDMEVNVTQSGFGVTPILGADFKYRRWNAGIKLEFNTDVEVKNHTRANTLPEGKKEAFLDGVKTDVDIPGMFTAGLQYELKPDLRTAVGWHYYFDPQANLSEQREDLLHRGINEYLWGLEWDCSDRLTLSCGAQYTHDGVSDSYQSDLSFSLSSYSMGLGGAYRISPHTCINAGYFCTVYQDYRVDYADYNGTGTAGSNEYARKNDTLGAGVEFRF